MPPEDELFRVLIKNNNSFFILNPQKNCFHDAEIMIQVFGFKIRRNHILSNYQIYILRFGTDRTALSSFNTGVLKILPSRSLFILSYSVVPVPGCILCS